MTRQQYYKGILKHAWEKYLHETYGNIATLQ